MRTLNGKYRAAVLLATIIGGLACGCSKLTYERWQTIHDGASRTGVEATLGEPSTQFDQRWQYHDPDRQITADIYFDGDKVIGKSWHDPERPWEGDSPSVTKPGDVEHSRTTKIE